MKFFKRNSVIVGMGILLFIGIWFLPRVKKEIVGKANSTDAQGPENFAKEFFSSLTDSIRSEYIKVKEDNFVAKYRFWYERKNIAGIVSEYVKFAAGNNADTLWASAGRWFVRMALTSSTEQERKFSYRMALRCFENAIEGNPSIRSYWMDKGTVLVESGINPMEGIGILRKMEQQDSLDVELLVRLGKFSLQSGQMAKAIHRLKKVTMLDSTRLDAHLYLADAYKEINEISQCLYHLKYFAARTRNPEEKLAAMQFIQELEKNNMSNP